MGEHKIRVALADDQRLLREGLRIILEAAPDIIIVGGAEDGVAATVLAAEVQPDVMLIDIRMPLRDGIVATEMIHKAHPDIHIILLTTFDIPDQVVEGLRAGAMGYILKDCSAEELCSAVRTVARGQVLLQTASAAQLLIGFSPSAPSPPQEQVETLGLTERECDVLRLLVQGRTNREMAADLYISETTIKTHINHIFAKLGARDRAHAVILAHRLGFFL